MNGTARTDEIFQTDSTGEYLNYANKQAEDGVNIGTDKIHRD